MTRLSLRLRKLLCWLCQSLVVAGALAVLVVALTPQGRVGATTFLFVLEILESPIKPQVWFSPTVIRHSVRYPSGGRTSVAEIYRLPYGEPRAAVVLSLGVTDRGFEHSYAVRLGHALARSGIVVMYHWSPYMGLGYRLDPDQVETLVSAFEFLEARPYVDLGRVGLGGFCVGGSYALVAAADPAIRDRVTLVNVFGPYYDAGELLLQGIARTAVDDGRRTPWQPDPITTRVLSNELIAAVGNPTDTAILNAHFPGGPEITAAELEALTPLGRDVATLLGGTGLDESRRLLMGLPGQFHDDLARISPSAHLQEIRAGVLVMHDRDDLAVPVSESRRLVEALTPRVEVEFTEFVSFDHTVPGPGGMATVFGQAWRLYSHMYRIVRIAS